MSKKGGYSVASAMLANEERDLNYLKVVLGKNKIKKHTINKIIFLLLNDKEKYLHEIYGLMSILEGKGFYNTRMTAKIIEKYLKNQIVFKNETQKDYWVIRLKFLLLYTKINLEDLGMSKDLIKNYILIFRTDLKDEEKWNKLYNIYQELKKIRNHMNTSTVDEMKYHKEIYMFFNYREKGIKNNFYKEFIKPCEVFLTNR